MICGPGFAGSAAAVDAGTSPGAGGAGKAFGAGAGAKPIDAGRATEAFGARGGVVVTGSISTGISASALRMLAWTTSLATCNASVTLPPLVATCNPFTTAGDWEIDLRTLAATSAAAPTDPVSRIAPRSRPSRSVIPPSKFRTLPLVTSRGIKMLANGSG